MKICYSFASRSRPEKFFAALDNIREMSASHNYYIIAKIDTDDMLMNNSKVTNKIRTYPEVILKRGHSLNKVHAINRDLEKMDCDIVCCHSDDMVFTIKGFDDIIREHMEPDIFLHFPDGHVNEKLCTYSIMHIDYYNRFGYIYNPAYKSLWCDNEQTEVAKILGRYKYIDHHIFEHKHPMNGRAMTDRLYKKNESLYFHDQGTYNKRKAINFEL